MTTALKPISLPTPDGARTPFPEAASKPSQAPDDRFRDTLDRRVSDDRTPREDRSARPKSNDRGDRAADNGAQETRPGAETTGSERTNETSERSPDAPTPEKDVAIESDASPDESAVATDESAAQIAASASVDIQAKLSAIAAKAAASADENLAKLGSTDALVDPQASEQTNSPATQNKSAQSAQSSTLTQSAAAQSGAQTGAKSDDAALNIATDGDEVAALPIDRPQNTNTGRPSDETSNRAQNSAQGVSLQQNTEGGETSSDGDASSDKRHDSPALKLVSPERGHASADTQAFTVEASASTPERTEAAQSSAGPRLSVTGEPTDRGTQNERAVASAVSRGLAAAVQQRGGSLTLRLAPESLGAVRIDLDLSQGRVSANIHASTEAAQETLAKSIQTLRSSLESKGLAVDRLTVQLTPQAQSGQQTSSDANGDDGARDQAQGDRDASDGQSRGRDSGRGDSEQQQGFGERFDDAFGLDPKDPRAQTLRLRFSAVG